MKKWGMKNLENLLQGFLSTMRSTNRNSSVPLSGSDELGAWSMSRDIPGLSSDGNLRNCHTGSSNNETDQAKLVEMKHNGTK